MLSSSVRRRALLAFLLLAGALLPFAPSARAEKTGPEARWEIPGCEFSIVHVPTRDGVFVYREIGRRRTLLGIVPYPPEGMAVSPRGIRVAWNQPIAPGRAAVFGTDGAGPLRDLSTDRMRALAARMRPLERFTFQRLRFSSEEAVRAKLVAQGPDGSESREVTLYFECGAPVVTEKVGVKKRFQPRPERPDWAENDERWRVLFPESP